MLNKFIENAQTAIKDRGLEYYLDFAQRTIVAIGTAAMTLAAFKLTGNNKPSPRSTLNGGWRELDLDSIYNPDPAPVIALDIPEISESEAAPQAA